MVFSASQETLRSISQGSNWVILRAEKDHPKLHTLGSVQVLDRLRMFKYHVLGKSV